MYFLCKIGIIGGTGLDDPDILEGRTEKYVDTPYGKPSDALILGKIKNVDCVLLARHGRHHTIMPSNVNYRANIWALKEENCSHILVTTACGSLREEIQPGDLVIIDQFIDSNSLIIQRYWEKEEGDDASDRELFVTDKSGWFVHLFELDFAS
ncbi:hypothetical protein BTVI_13824 [Pitangus sulphuratus]|nr:hypothetical protein BTVI_13824 [Pitangus sulphuratus]